MILIEEVDKTKVTEVVNSLEKNNKKINPKVSFSIGVAQEENSIEEAIKRADKKMYERKKRQKEGKWKV